MSKIKIKQVLKSNDDIYEYNGFGIKRENKITYFDNNIKTSVVIDDIITLNRISDYQINLNFKKNEVLNGYYLNNYGKINLNVKTDFIKNDNNCLEIHYTLLSDNHKISNFKFILEYGIDT